jgi:aminoglycoside/choline kinase family phosphotransferase
MTRETAIAAFLDAQRFGAAVRVPLAQDSSFRRYWRLTGGPRPAVLMDAPPPEDTAAFLRVGAHLAGIGLSVPEVIGADRASGLLLLEDFGDALFAAGPAAEDVLCDAAVEALLAMQAAPPPSDLPAWDAEAMTAAALATLLDWWWPAALGGPAPAAARAEIAAGLRAMLAPLDAAPRVLVHRDYFASNLIWLPGREDVRRVGILDFQSAARGHPAYDLASLIEDARRDTPPGMAARAMARFAQAGRVEDVAASVAVCGAQRHLRVAALWVRLARRDGKPHYLAHGVRTWARLEASLAHPACAPLAAALDRWIPSERRRNPAAVAA